MHMYVKHLLSTPTQNFETQSLKDLLQAAFMEAAWCWCLNYWVLRNPAIQFNSSPKSRSSLQLVLEKMNKQTNKKKSTLFSLKLQDCTTAQAFQKLYQVLQGKNYLQLTIFLSAYKQHQ